ncbi:MAG: phosphorylase family protein [Candidatus Eutrophobiaceae bacterium]
MDKLGIITALPSEAHCLGAGKLAAGVIVPLANGTLLCASGMGEMAINRAFKLLLEKDITALLNLGVAGALRTECQSGDLVIPNSILDTDGTYTVDGEWHRELWEKLNTTQETAGLPLRDGALFSADRIVSGAAQRQALANQHGCIAVDMEAALLARLCQKHGIRFASIKAIADEINVEMPNCILKHIDSLGKPIMPAFALHVLTHPLEWRALLQIAQGWRKARNSLRRACRAKVAQ